MKKFRMLLPVFAILFAAAGALATNLSSNTDIIDVSLQPATEVCSFERQCDISVTTETCKLDEQEQLYNLNDECRPFSGAGEIVE